MSEDTQLAVMMAKQERMSQDIKEIKDTVQQNYVTQEQFKPIRLFVYGIIGIALSGMGVAVINLVIRK
jgi:tetrahydromethanopterin S-methyltransferase subunit D